MCRDEVASVTVAFPVHRRLWNLSRGDKVFTEFSFLTPSDVLTCNYCIKMSSGKVVL